MSGVNIRNELGPYKATKLWNDIVRIFRTRMPIGRHWRQLRAYDDCFIASEAVDWLFEFLQHHHDADLTRSQVVKLLQKFHRNRYIEDVKGDKYNAEVFDENNRLFRFVALSPIKTPQWPRVQSVTAPGLEPEKRLSDLKTNNLFKQLEPTSDAASTDTSSVDRSSDSCPSSRSSTSGIGSYSERETVDVLWKTVVIERLQAILPDTGEAHSLHQRLAAIKRNHIRHNMTIVHKNGYVTGISRSELPPSWLISAMRYLAKWPNEGEESFPEYAGFEKDVLMMIKDYFESLRHPLTTYTLYPVLVQAYKLLDKTRPSPIEREANRVLHVSETTPRKYSTHSQSRTSYREAASSYSAMKTEAAARFKNSHIPRPVSCADSHRPRTDVMIVYDGHNNPQPSGQHDYPPFSTRTSSQPTHVNMDSGQNRRHSSGQSSREDQPARRRHRWQVNRPNMTRSASFSHLLGGSRVETAFVADGAHTVYHGSCHKPNIRDSSSLANSTNRLTRAQSAYDIDYKPANQVPAFCESVPTRSVSNRYLAGEDHPASRPSSQLCGSGVHPMQQYSQLPRHQSLNDVNRIARRGSSDRQDDSERYIDTGSIRLRFHSTPSMHMDDSLPYELFNEEYRQRLAKCLQLILLFLPPSNRRVLHMLLKLLNKTSSNTDLVFESGLSNRRLVTQLFWRCIVNCEDGREVESEMSVKIVQFLVENMEDIMSVPRDVKCEVERRIHEMRQPAEPKVTPHPTALRNRTNLPSQQGCLPSKPAGIPAKAIGRLGITTPGKVFCEQITAEQYKNQADEMFELSMKELLKNIIEDQKMSVKEKMKRLKQFERAYPEIYAQRFPTVESVKTALDDFERNRPKVKQPLLSRPMSLLKKLR